MWNYFRSMDNMRCLVFAVVLYSHYLAKAEDTRIQSQLPRNYIFSLFRSHYKVSLLHSTRIVYRTFESGWRACFRQNCEQLNLEPLSLKKWPCGNLCMSPHADLQITPSLWTLSVPQNKIVNISIEEFRSFGTSQICIEVKFDIVEFSKYTQDTKSLLPYIDTNQFDSMFARIHKMTIGYHHISTTAIPLGNMRLLKRCCGEVRPMLIYSNLPNILLSLQMVNTPPGRSMLSFRIAFQPIDDDQSIDYPFGKHYYRRMDRDITLAYPLVNVSTFHQILTQYEVRDWHFRVRIGMVWRLIIKSLTCLDNSTLIVLYDSISSANTVINNFLCPMMYIDMTYAGNSFTGGIHIVTSRFQDENLKFNLTIWADDMCHLQNASIHGCKTSIVPPEGIHLEYPYPQRNLVYQREMFVASREHQYLQLEIIQFKFAGIRGDPCEYFGLMFYNVPLPDPEIYLCHNLFIDGMAAMGNNISFSSMFRNFTLLFYYFPSAGMFQMRLRIKHTNYPSLINPCSFRSHYTHYGLPPHTTTTPNFRYLRNKLTWTFIRKDRYRQWLVEEIGHAAFVITIYNTNFVAVKERDNFLIQHAPFDYTEVEPDRYVWEVLCEVDLQSFYALDKLQRLVMYPKYSPVMQLQYPEQYQCSHTGATMYTWKYYAYYFYPIKASQPYIISRREGIHLTQKEFDFRFPLEVQIVGLFRISTATYAPGCNILVDFSTLMIRKSFQADYVPHIRNLGEPVRYTSAFIHQQLHSTFTNFSIKYDDRHSAWDLNCCNWNFEAQITGLHPHLSDNSDSLSIFVEEMQCMIMGHYNVLKFDGRAVRYNWNISLNHSSFTWTVPDFNIVYSRRPGGHILLAFRLNLHNPKSDIGRSYGIKIFYVRKISEYIMTPPKTHKNYFVSRLFHTGAAGAKYPCISDTCYFVPREAIEREAMELSWQQAQNFCARNDSYLMSVNSESEFRHVIRYARRYDENHTRYSLTSAAFLFIGLSIANKVGWTFIVFLSC